MKAYDGLAFELSATPKASLFNKVDRLLKKL